MREWLALGVLVVASPVACAGRAPRAEAQHREAPVCPHDAAVVGGACRCAAGLTVLDGACVGPRELDAYCGAPALGGVCAAPTCARGDPLDLGTGACVPAETARAILARARPIPEELAPGCRDGRALVVRGQDYVACFPVADACPPSTAWDAAAGRCSPVPACAPGEVREDSGGCARVVAGGPDGVPVVDVGGWARAMLGANGGDGALRLCRPLGLHPWDLDIGPGGARTLETTIQLIFPDNDVTQVSGRAETVDAASRQPLLGPGGRAAQRALDALLVPLRALGGASDAASATIRVRCTVRGGASPFLAPRP